ncbi:hypothetical protein DUI87_21393 [Hirundo rustica rustica]|uniref:Uncharacterized protein n=1 Tax=Hirundo rustica rustica TaxID=333673 RepID=A0A3M0JMN7_HIRRU|nr:hypothetical protein DUI87_21393 [Hirundo rustica rustica]
MGRDGALPRRGKSIKKDLSVYKRLLRVHRDCRAVLMVLPRTVRLKVTSAWKPALISVPIAVTSMGHLGNAEVQLQLVKFDGLELFNKKA